MATVGATGRSRWAPFLLVAVGLAGCQTTGVVHSDLGQDISGVQQQYGDPELLEGAPPVEVAAADLYRAVRLIPTAALCTAYDAPMAVEAEALILLSHLWGGQDRVAEAAYDTWKAVKPTDDAINPLPRAVDTRLPPPPDRPRTGWTTETPAEQ